MLTVILVIPALCIWTGYGLLQLIGPRQVRLGIPVGLFVYGLTGMLLLGWLALVAAELGFFSAWAVLIFGIVVGAAGWLVVSRHGSRVQLSRAEGSRSENIFLIGLIALMGVLYLRPHEFIFGGADAGVYVNLGSQIARSGRWLISNPDLSAIPIDDYPMLFREQTPDQQPRFYQLPGFYIADNDASAITPQFYPLHPVWLAVADGLGGLWANLFMTPLCGMLGVLAVYFAVRESFDVRVAMLAGGLLAITPTQIWFARYPTAEVLTQFLIFAGLYAFARYVRRGEGWAALLAGVALGEVMLVRIDTYFVLGLPIVYAAYLHLRRRFDRRFWLLAAPMLLLGLHSLLHAVWQGWPYFYNTFFSRGGRLPVSIWIVVGGLMIALFAYVVFDLKVARRPGWETRWQPAWKITLTLSAIGLVLLALYAYFLLPRQAAAARQAAYWYTASTIPDVEPYNLVRLGWYLSPLGIALGVLGIASIVRERVAEHTWALVGLGVFFALLYVYRTYNNPHQIYVMRRYVPTVFPFFALGIAYALHRLAGWRPVGQLAAIGLGLAQIGLLIYAGRAVIPEIDYQGGVDQFRLFAQQIPANSIVLFNDDEPVGVTGVYGTPLAYLAEHTVLDLQESNLDVAKLDQLVAGWLADGRNVTAVDGPNRVSGLCDRWQCRKVATAQFRMPVLEQTYEHFPFEITPWQNDLDIYEVQSVKP